MSRLRLIPAAVAAALLLVAASSLPAAQAAPAAKPTPAPAAPQASPIPLTADDLGQFAWRPIGPWAFSGRITNFAVPPGQSLTYYVLTATGGLWKTEDGGTHFEPIFDKYGNMSMGYLAIAPSKPDVLYLGTGEPIHSRAAYHGNGLWKSTDAGKTWARAGLEKSSIIPKIEVDPRNPDVVYVACEGRLYDNGMDCDRGLFKSVDGGKAWTRVLGLSDRGVGDVVMDPTNPDVLIASSYKLYRRAWTYLDRQTGNCLYKTVDGGKTWSKCGSGLPDLDRLKTGRNGLALSAKNPKKVFLRLDEEVDLGLSQRVGEWTFREGGLFRPESYLKKFRESKVPAPLAALAKVTAPPADTEKALAKALNDWVKDPGYAKSACADLTKLCAAARKVYAKDEDALEAVGQVEKLLAGGAAEPEPWKTAHGLIAVALFAGSEGVAVKDGALRVTDPAKAAVGDAFKDHLTYDAKDVKDAADLAARLDALIASPDFTVRLKIDAKRVFNTAKTAYKDKKEILDLFKDSDAVAETFEESRGRYQAVNRAVLQLVYGAHLSPMEATKNAGTIYRSDDQGATWTRLTEYKRTAGSDVVNQVEAGYNGRLLVDPNDDQVLYAHETRTTVSKDGGKTFKFANWESNGVHVDSRAVWVDPLDSRHILNANDGGVSESRDGGKHWSQKETIAAQQFYDVFVDQAVPYNVMGGTQDNGCWIGPSMNRNPNGVFPADWLYLPSGDGFYVVRDWWNPEYIYWESQFGYSQRMNLKTGEQTALSRRNTPEEDAAGAAPQRYQWNAPIVLSPHNPGIVYVCSQAVHRSLRRGEPGSWTTISPDLTKADPEKLRLSRKTNLQWATIFAFAESPKTPGIYWAGTDDGNLQLSRDGGTTWTNVTARFYDKAGRPKPVKSGARIPYDRWVKRVCPSAFDAATCYVVYSGYREPGEDTTYVYVTRDFGETFQDIGGGMANPASDIEEDPDNAGVLYLSTDYGLFVTFDRGRSWSELSAKAPDVIMKDAVVQRRERELVVATFGRGIYVVDVGPFAEFKPETFAQDAHLFAVKDAVQWSRHENRGNSLGETAKAGNPPVGATVYYWLKAEAKKVLVTVRDADGAVVQELTASGRKGINKAFWNLSRKVDFAALEGLDRAERARRTRLAPGTYKVVLSVDGKEAGTRTVVVKPDPIDRMPI